MRMIGLICLSFIAIFFMKKSAFIQAQTEKQETKQQQQLFATEKDEKFTDTLPNEGTELFEEKLKNDVQFKGYVQTLSKVSMIEKMNFESFSLNGNTTINDVKETKDGNFILTIANRNDQEYWVNRIFVFCIYLVKVTPDGQILNVLNIATSNNTVAPSNNTEQDGSFASDPSAIFENNHKYAMFYTGYTPQDKVHQKRMLSFDENLENLQYTTLQQTSYPGFYGNAYHQNQENDILNLGYLTNLTNAEVHTDKQMPIEKRDPTTGSVVEVKWFTLPSFAKLNEDATAYQAGWNAAINIRSVDKTSDGGYLANGFTNVPDAEGAKKIGITNFYVKWNAAGQYEWYKTSIVGGAFSTQTDLTTNSELVTTKIYNETKETELIKINLLTGKEEILHHFPPLTNITLKKNKSVEFKTEYDFYGYVASMTGEFEGYKNGPGMVVGSLKKDYQLASANFLQSDAPISIGTLTPIPNTDYFFVSGLTYSQTFSKMPPLTGWVPKRPYIEGTNSFFGSMKKIEDWAPAISAPARVVLNMDDADLALEKKNGQQGILDNWLLTGEKNGSLTSPLAVKVADTYDLHPEYGKLTAAELQAKINKNPLDNDLAIDWESLGFKLEERGPQKVKYFIADTSKQTTVTSRWINKVDDETIYNEKGALAVSNFAIDVKDVATIDEIEVKKLAKGSKYRRRKR